MHLSPMDLAAIATCLPLLCTSLAMTLAGFLSQDKWPDHVNDVIACAFVVIFAAVDIYISGQFITGNLFVLIGVFTATITVELAYVCKPLQRWTRYLQSTVLVLAGDGFHAIIPLPATPPIATIVVSNTPTGGTITSTTSTDGEVVEIAKTQFIASPPPLLVVPTPTEDDHLPS